MLVDTLSDPPQDSGGDLRHDPVASGTKAARGALSANTERAVRSDLAIYTTWCDARGLRALPARTETIAAFVDAMATDRAPATVRRYVASVAAAHRAVGLEKTARSEPVRRALQRMHRQKGRRQAQATGLTGSLRKRLLDAAGDELIDARNRALIAVAYDTLLRRSELIALQVSDIVEECDGSATVLVRRSKSDPEGRGATLYLAPDGVALVREWLKRSGVREGRLFRSLCRGLVGEGLDASLHVLRRVQHVEPADPEGDHQSQQRRLGRKLAGHRNPAAHRRNPIGQPQQPVAGPGKALGVGVQGDRQHGHWR